MIVDDDKLREIARTKSGDLAQVPFPTLLFALWRHKRTCVLELSRGQLHKNIVLEEGTPVDCESNLLHETLGKFLCAEGKLTDDQYQKVLTASARAGEPMGTVLVRNELLSAFDLFRALQQNLARKLLDVFTWETGAYRVLGDAPEIDSALKVNVPQLVMTGIDRVVPKARVDLAIGALIGGSLAIDHEAYVDVDTLRLSTAKARMVQLVRKRLRIDEVMREASVSAEEVMRFFCALAVLRILRPSSEVPVEPEPTPAAESVPAAAPAPTPVTVVPAAARASVEEVMSLFVDHRRRDSFDLLGLEEEAEAPARADAWLAFAERFAPWGFVDDEGRRVQDKARELFLAGARAYGELSDVERRNSVINRRRNLSKQSSKNYSFAIKTELLDARSQYTRGLELMSSGQYREAEDLLAYAVDLQPTDGTFRSELSYCKFLQHPEQRAQAALLELDDVQRMDPTCGIAWLYKGEVHVSLGEFDQARASYARAAELMGPDPRPRDALSRVLNR